MSISKNEQTFLNHIQQQELSVFNTEEVRYFWGSPENTDNGLSRLLHKKQLVRIVRGIYALPSFFNTSASNPYSQRFLIAPHLVSDSAIAYGSAMQLHGFTANPKEDSVCFIQTLHRKKEMLIMGHRYRFIQVKPEHFFDIQVYSMHLHQGISIIGIEKTVIDGLNHPEYVNGIPVLLEFMKRFSNTIDWKHLTNSLPRIQNGAVIKRLGYLIDKFQIDIPDRANFLRQWHHLLTQGVVLLEPKKEQQGHIHTHWNVEDNVFDCKENDQ